MEDKNVFLAVKAALAGVAAAFTAAFGWLGWMVVAWVCCMVLDWVTGSASGMAQHNWSSKVARDGIWHKGGMVAVVLVAGATDLVIGLVVANLPGIGLGTAYSAMVLPVVLCWYIFTELGSILENARDMGAPVPKKLVELLGAARDKVEDAAEEKK